MNLRERIRIDNSTAMARGSLLHDWFEQIEWLDDGEPDEETLRRVARGSFWMGLDLDVEFSAFRGMLAQPATRAVLSRAGYHNPAELGFPAECCKLLQKQPPRLKVLREHPFAVRDADTLLQGFLDRLVLLCQGGRVVAADIVDFKTDALGPSEQAGIEAKVEYYRPQIEAYRRTVARLYDLDAANISARLLFVGPGIVRSLS